MKRILLTLLTLLMAFAAVQAQKISYIETTRSWHHVYDENGKKVYTFSTTQGEVVAYSDTFYIVKHDSWYHTYDAKGHRIHTFAVSNVGDILSATGDTFTSRKGNWIYTWSKSGRKIATRAAPR